VSAVGTRTSKTGMARLSNHYDAATCKDNLPSSLPHKQLYGQPISRDNNHWATGHCTETNWNRNSSSECTIASSEHLAVGTCHITFGDLQLVM
jgi:hypothetical protein